jgi:triosephosphate isomerase
MKKIIVANWKCNPETRKEAEGLFNEIKSGVKKNKKVETIIAAPFVWLPFLKGLTLAAQDCHWEEKGAYTGQISPKMLKSMGVEYVIIGHSERRKYFQETDEIINKKLKAALKLGLIPILCIGEKEGEDAKTVVDKQLQEDLNGISDKDLNNIIVAYEPIWAISTSGGEICSPETAKMVLGLIRLKFNGKIIYGGSVDSKIISGYLSVGYEGALVGGASLKGEEFVKTVGNA